MATDGEKTLSVNEKSWAEIKRLGLGKYVEELETTGYTIIPPGDIHGTPDLADRVLDAVLRVIEERTGARPDMDNGNTQQGLPQAAEVHDWMLFEDPVFEELLMNPVSLALATHLLTTGNEPLRPAAVQLQGRVPNVLLMTHNVLMKGPGDKPLHLHCDNGLMPGPFPRFQQICNTTLLLTDYSEAAGALCFVPGSHQWVRHPTPAERFDFSNAHIVEASKGSMIVWGGNQWHGAVPRTIPGIRATNVFTYCREYLPAYEGDVPQEIVDRNGPRFAELMGLHAFRPSKQPSVSKPKSMATSG
jgi:ectoine hydroxylase-related dioxygenase (phytanoyl-CoA dioxygenase family)